MNRQESHYLIYGTQRQGASKKRQLPVWTGPPGRPQMIGNNPVGHIIPDDKIRHVGAGGIHEPRLHPGGRGTVPRLLINRVQAILVQPLPPEKLRSRFNNSPRPWTVGEAPRLTFSITQSGSIQASGLNEECHSEPIACPELVEGKGDPICFT